MKDALLRQIEIEKRFAEKLISNKRDVMPHLVVFKGSAIIPIFVPDGDILSEMIKSVISEGFDMLVVSFEGKMKELPKSEFKEYMKTYRYGEILKDSKSIDVVVIWGIEKETNYRCLNVYIKGEKLSLHMKFENESFDRVIGRLSFIG
jgi:hypothetical protein